MLVYLILSNIIKGQILNFPKEVLSLFIFTLYLYLYYIYNLYYIYIQTTFEKFIHTE